jgi:hypothetical protein
VFGLYGLCPALLMVSAAGFVAMLMVEIRAARGLCPLLLVVSAAGGFRRCGFGSVDTSKCAFQFTHCGLLPCRLATSSPSMVQWRM